jgi:hypothetical protein
MLFDKWVPNIKLFDILEYVDVMRERGISASFTFLLPRLKGRMVED